MSLTNADTLQQAVTAASLARGSDPNKSLYHFVFAFDTTHFGDDAGQAEAMRAEAAHFAQGYLVPGDTYSVASWQMGVWNWQGPVAVAGASQAERARVVGGYFPQTHEASSAGGHDTEQAIVDVSGHLTKSGASLERRTILVLFTSLENSQDAPGRRSIGTNDARYQSVIKGWIRQPKLAVPFQEEKTPGRGDWVNRQFDAIVVVPQQIQGTPIATGTRASLLKQSTVVPRQGDVTHPSHLLWIFILVGLLVLGVGGLLLWKFRWGTSGLKSDGGTPHVRIKPGGDNSRRLSQLAIGDRQFSLNDYKEGATWRLVGPSFPGRTVEDITIGRKEDAVPPVQIGQLQLTDQKLQVRVFGEQTLLTSISGTQSQTFPIRPGENVFDLEGEYAPNPALATQPYQTQFTVTLL